MQTLASFDCCVDFGVPAVDIVSAEVISVLTTDNRQHRALDVRLAFFELPGLFVDIVQLGAQSGEAEGLDGTFSGLRSCAFEQRRILCGDGVDLLVDAFAKPRLPVLLFGDGKCDGVCSVSLGITWAGCRLGPARA